MWAFRLTGPGFVHKVEVPDLSPDSLQPGEVLLRLLVGGLCGSDMPRLNRIVVRPSAVIDYGVAPVHEVVGEVVASASDEFTVGQHVVGTAGGANGLAQFTVTRASTIIPVPAGVGDVEAVTIQSLGTVIRATSQFPPIAGKKAVVIGAGPIGLCFVNVLKQRGATHVTSIDPVERSDVARSYGADEFVNTRSTEWVRELDPGNRPDIVVETVGHQHATIPDALTAVAEHGFVYGFGSPDEANYVIPFQAIYEKAVTFAAGRTLGGWQDVLRGGEAHLLEHREVFSTYVSHSIPYEDAQSAYSLYARPQVGRLKVAIVADDL